MMTVGFIGLGNVGELTVRDLNRELAQPFLDGGAAWADSPAAMAEAVDVTITCLPSPAACQEVMEGKNGVLESLEPGKVWVEMSTTDFLEVGRLGERVQARGADAADCPVSGGCHRAATGNIAILAGCNRSVFERLLPLLTVLGRRVLHTGELGSASPPI